MGKSRDSEEIFHTLRSTSTLRRLPGKHTKSAKILTCTPTVRRCATFSCPSPPSDTLANYTVSCCS